MPNLGFGIGVLLRGELKGLRSRRVTLEDRLVYRVSGSGSTQQLEIGQALFCCWVIEFKTSASHIDCQYKGLVNEDN
jgi:YoeB-like toxin of bacterial type II toxin-antitoxin system